MQIPAPGAPRALLRHCLSGGFRPFFLAGALHAALMIGLWVPWYLGFLHVPTALSPLAWHQHELLYGYVPAIIAGFLLAAVPNWTARRPISGLPLLCLFALWLAGRLAIAGSESIGPATAMIVAGAFLPVLAIAMLRELVLARNARNYKVAIVLFLLSATQWGFYYEFDRFGLIDISNRLAIAAIILLICVIGGRIIPAFTGNWLRARGPGTLPTPFNHVDMAVMVLTALALVAWPLAASYPSLQPIPGMLLVAAGIAQLFRQARWTPHRTLAEPLVTILHLAFFFVPLGFGLIGAAALLDDPGLQSAGIHSWTSGAIGTMTLAVMTRATRGHTGQSLHAPRTTVILIYAPIVLATLARIAAALYPGEMMLLLPLAALLWIVAFLAFALLYGPLLLRK